MADMTMGFCFGAKGKVPEVAIDKVADEKVRRNPYWFSNDIFSRHLYIAMKHNSKDNMCFSPLSLGICLTLTYLGAGGNTAAEIKKVLNLPESKGNVVELLRSVLELTKTTQLESSNRNWCLKMSNGLYTNPGLEFKVEFVKKITNEYGADLNSVDFTSPETALLVTQFIAEKTEGRIPVSFSTDELKGLAGLVLIDALAFDADWQNYFERDIKDFFFLNVNKKVLCKFMSVTGRYKYLHVSKLKASVVSMAYWKINYRMILIIPDEIEGLADVEGRLIRTDLKELMSGKLFKMRLQVPVFSLKTENDFVKPLKKLGLLSLFNDSADLSGISEMNLKCMAIKQKNVMEVNMRGTATAPETAAFSERPVRKRFAKEKIKVDRPFIYLICHQPTATVLFMGRLVTVEEVPCDNIYDFHTPEDSDEDNDIDNVSDDESEEEPETDQQEIDIQGFRLVRKYTPKEHPILCCRTSTPSFSFSFLNSSNDAIDEIGAEYTRVLPVDDVFKRFYRSLRWKSWHVSNQRFSINMYLALKHTLAKSGNVCFSPFCLQFALTLAHLGSRGNTAAEIKDILDIPEAKSCFLSTLRTIKDFVVPPAVFFRFVNELFIQRNHTIKEDFVKAAQRYFGATVKIVDFTSDETIERINAYIHKCTDRAIENIFMPGSLDPSSLLVFVNTICFSGIFLHGTKLGHYDFYLTSTTKVKCNFLKVDSVFPCKRSSALKAQIVRIPYMDSELNIHGYTDIFDLVLVIPNRKDGLDRLEDRLHTFDLHSLVHGAQEKEVFLLMPIIKFECNYNLIEPLRRLGIRDMFSSKAADFGEMCEKRVHCSAVQQKTTIKVSGYNIPIAGRYCKPLKEEDMPSAEAEVTCCQTAVGPEKHYVHCAHSTKHSTSCKRILVIADRPFVFFIQHRPTGVMLLMGRYSRVPKNEKPVGHNFSRDLKAYRAAVSACKYNKK